MKNNVPVVKKLQGINLLLSLALISFVTEFQLIVKLFAQKQTVLLNCHCSEQHHFQLQQAAVWSQKSQMNPQYTSYSALGYLAAEKQDLVDNTQF